MTNPLKIVKNTLSISLSIAEHFKNIHGWLKEELVEEVASSTHVNNICN